MAKRKPTACQRNEALVRKMVAHGSTLTEIANRVGTNRTRVKEFLHREGIHGKFQRSRPAGPGHQCYKGGRIVDKDGYVSVYLPGHPMARKPAMRYVLEHRLVMSEHMGRLLDRSEVVHHKNGNKSDNRIENLILYESNSDHLQEELKGKTPKWTRTGLIGMIKHWLRISKTPQARNRWEKELHALRSPQKRYRRPSQLGKAPVRPSRTAPQPELDPLKS